jgi:hypothetical protein
MTVACVAYTVKDHLPGISGTLPILDESYFRSLGTLTAKVTVIEERRFST